MIEEANPELIGFFSSMVNAIIPKDRLAYNKQEAKKSVVALCYMIAGLRNKFVNQFKIEVGLYLAASGVMWEAIDTLSRDCLHIYNINDYHNIHEKRRPDTTSTSVVKHFTTCVAKPITECPTVLVVFNGISVHNPNNVEALRICWYLLNKYTGIFDILYSKRHYDDTIAERKHKRSMSGLQLIGFKEQHLHSMQDYLNALKMILAVNKNSKCLEGHVAPIVADWPGPLHLSLNSREHVMIIYHFLFEKMFHFVFDERKKLVKKSKPWRINLLLEVMRNGWVKIIKDVIMQKFGLACKDVEYQITIDLLDNLIPATLDVYAILFRSASLVFLSDIFYWQDNHHPFADAIKNYLPCFNDYYVENTHSQIRANTSPNATVENIIKQAYIIANHDPIFKDVYCKTYRYLYSSSTLDFLSNKTSLFLLEHFCSIFHNQNNSIPVYSGGKKKKLKGYKLATLGKEVDLCHLPTAYTLACGHGYYPSCYGRRCIYCENFYKNGIFENVNSFLKKIEKGKDTLTQNNLNDENNEEEKEESSEEPVNEQAVVSAMLEAAINNINYW
ncbi:hypothetical protein RhiirA5_427105 [Rhizophagus irregularis]|uniref:Uncharacterized protein n=1 Tax=Rhizophagus irregularis TaxID=588596 RepID=A0A2N0RNH0_9GLOM|nr:hypothetical protein RhiirA5_427105 [Rhizophagus irregularis]PKC64848.1 hypothetical protein RhiirA1_461862 [Rhizophagus irregularis]